VPSAPWSGRAARCLFHCGHSRGGRGRTPSPLRRYLVPSDLTVGQFVYVIRKRIKLSPEKAIFIFVGNVLPPTASMMSTVYESNKDEDGFLYITYSGENTFGALGLEEL